MSYLSNIVHDLNAMTEKVRGEIVGMATRNFYPIEIEPFDAMSSIAIIFNSVKVDDSSIEDITLAELRTNTGNYSVAYVSRYDRSGRFINEDICFPDLDDVSKASLKVFLKDPYWLDEADMHDHAESVFEGLHEALEEKI